MYVLRACFYWQLPLVLFFHKKKGEIGAKWLHTNIIWVFENGGLFRVEKNSKLNCTKRTMAYSLQLGLVSSCIHLTAKCIQITLLPSSFFGRAIFTPFLLHVHDEWCLSLVLGFAGLRHFKLLWPTETTFSPSFSPWSPSSNCVRWAPDISLR